MALIGPKQKQAFNDLVREIIKTRPMDLTKSDLKAAIDAVDDWIEANKTSLNTAIPEPAKSSLTVAEKGAILLIVVSAKLKA